MGLSPNMIKVKEWGLVICVGLRINEGLMKRVYRIPMKGLTKGQTGLESNHFT